MNNELAPPLVEPIAAVPPEQRPIDIVSAPPPAWVSALKGCEEWRLSSTARAGIDALRRAAHAADQAAELLGDAVRMETEPTARAFLRSLYRAALHLLVPLDHVARGGNLSPAVERYARGFGCRKGDEVAAALRRAAKRPFHEWARAGGIKAPAPLKEKPEPQPREVQAAIEVRRILQAAGAQEAAAAPVKRNVDPRAIIRAARAATQPGD
jgi:hypothetical protein